MCLQGCDLDLDVDVVVSLRQHANLYRFPLKKKLLILTISTRPCLPLSKSVLQVASDSEESSIKSVLQVA